MTTKDFIRLLGIYRKELTKQEIKTIKGQAKSGDVDAAMNGLKNVLERSRHAKM